MKKIFFLLLLLSTPAFAQNKTIINEVYEIFETDYIKENIIKELALNTIKQIEIIDNNIKIKDMPNNIDIYLKANKLASFDKPKQNSAKGWADITNEIITTVQKKSSVITDDIVIKKSVDSFDDNSNKFFSSVKFKNYKFERKRNFDAEVKEDKLYIKIKTINETILNSIITTINKHKNAKELILDLQDNNGGNLKSAYDIINLFIDGGIIFTTKGRDKKIKIYQAKEGDIFKYKPISILVNENTASAAELIAFAMQNGGRANIYGKKTYQKNSIQSLFIINGAGLSLTTDYFFDANGKKPQIIHQSQQNP